MPPLPRGICSVCNADVALRRPPVHYEARVTRQHKDRRHPLYATGRNEEVPTCAGSGLPPKEPSA